MPGESKAPLVEDGVSLEMIVVVLCCIQDVLFTAGFTLSTGASMTCSSIYGQGYRDLPDHGCRSVYIMQPAGSDHYHV